MQPRIDREGGAASLFYLMNHLDLMLNISQWLQEELAEGPLFLVAMEQSKSGNKLNIMIDGDEGVGIDQCAKLSRSLSAKIDENEELLSGPMTLEVSSPGADQPLQMPRQYPKHMGRELNILLADGRKLEAELLKVQANGIVVKTETGKGKKKEITEHALSFDEIKEAKVKLSFKKK